MPGKRQRDVEPAIVAVEVSTAVLEMEPSPGPTNDTNDLPSMLAAAEDGAESPSPAQPPRSSRGGRRRKPVPSETAATASVGRSAPPPVQPTTLAAVQRAVTESEQMGRELAEAKRRLDVIRQSIDEAERDLDETRQRRQAMVRERIDAETELHEVRRQAEAVREEIAAGVGQVRSDAEEAQQAAQLCRQDAERLRALWPEVQVQTRQTLAEVANLHQECVAAAALLLESHQQLQLVTKDADGAVERLAEVRRALGEGLEALASAVSVPADPPADRAVEHQLPPLSDAPPADHKGPLGAVVDREAVVVELLPSSFGERAGLQIGDRITAVGDTPIADADDLRRALEDAAIGGEAILAVVRDDTTETIPVHFAEPVPA